MIYASDPDLKVRAIKENTGELAWAFNTPNTYRCVGAGQTAVWSGEECVEYRFGWPVVADNEGVVMVRLRMTYQDSWDFGKYYDDPEFPIPPGPEQSPPDNQGIKSLFTKYKKLQPVYALNLDTGKESFIPLVKSSGFMNGYLNHGPMPAVSVLFPMDSKLHTCFFRLLKCVTWQAGHKYLAEIEMIRRWEKWF